MNFINLGAGMESREALGARRASRSTQKPLPKHGVDARLAA